MRNIVFSLVVTLIVESDRGSITAEVEKVLRKRRTLWDDATRRLEAHRKPTLTAAYSCSARQQSQKDDPHSLHRVGNGPLTGRKIVMVPLTLATAINQTVRSLHSTPIKRLINIFGFQMNFLFSFFMSFSFINFNYKLNAILQIIYNVQGDVCCLLASAWGWWKRRRASLSSRMWISLAYRRGQIEWSVK